MSRRPADTSRAHVTTENVGPALFVVTGPSAAGKTTVSRLLAERFAAGVHLEGDFFRRSIVSGGLEMTPGAAPQALDQLRLRYRLATQAAEAYVADGFTVVLDDVVAGPMLPEFVSGFRSRPLQVIVLMPDAEALAARESARAEEGYHAWSIGELYRLFAEETPRIGAWLDTSGQTPDQTVDAILRLPPVDT